MLQETTEFETSEAAPASTPKPHYALHESSRVIQTSAAGERLAEKPALEFQSEDLLGDASIRIYPERTRQKLNGIGSSFTESAAFVLAHLPVDERKQLMQEIFGEEGANFAMARTVIGACDFSVNGRYSYADKKGDVDLKSFSVGVDEDGFDPQQYPGIKDPSYDLLPMIKEALAVKAAQDDSQLRIVASPWTAPAWMKDIEDWYINGTSDDEYMGGGVLKPMFKQLYADYLVRYLKAYNERGVPIWAITPVNEPLGNSGQWESMHFTAETQAHFIRHYLGPTLSARMPDVKLYMYDHNRSDLENWADTVYCDIHASRHLHGAAIHWYDSSYKVYDAVLESVHNKYPNFDILQTEGCVESLGAEAPEGVQDPEHYKEQGWFNNDAFWWNDNATDWAYSATWPGVIADDHPIYTPVHRYARDIIGCINHWVSGWIDWNVVLDSGGGPNHVGNFCAAPIMVNTETSEIYRTPIFYILSQFSKTIRPGDRAVRIKLQHHRLEDDVVHACATLDANKHLSVHVLNTSDRPLEVPLNIGDQSAMIHIDANAMQTVQLPLPGLETT